MRGPVIVGLAGGLALAALVGCDGAAECIAEFPATEHPDTASDATYYGDGLSPVELGSVRSRCAEHGLPCATEPLLGREAALCLARQRGLLPGESPWTAFFRFDDDHAAAWRVCNMLESGVGGARGQCLHFDAVSGAFLASDEWQVGA